MAAVDRKIDAYQALSPGSFQRLVRVEITPGEERQGESLDLTIEAERDDGARLVLTFHTVTELRIDDLRSTRPDSLEITDLRQERGWESVTRYGVADCCQGPISFYCADFSAEMHS